MSLSVGEIKLDLPRLLKGVAAITAGDIGLRVKHNPASAESLTNAHEIGAVNRNTEADHQMDYNNNKVGRDYAKAGYAEGQILQMVRTDPQVIRVSQP